MNLPPTSHQARSGVLSSNPTEVPLEPPRPEPDTVDGGEVLSEATDVARAQDGDVAAFSRIVLAYEAELTRLAFRTVTDRGDAQDVVQESFALAWRRLPSLADPQAFRAWIYQITTRQSLNFARHRTQARTDLTADGLESDPAPARAQRHQPNGDGPEAFAQGHAQRRALDEMLGTLPVEQRACWVLKDLHGLSYPEIAYATGVPVSTVRGRIARARHALAAGMTAWQ